MKGLEKMKPLFCDSELSAELHPQIDQMMVAIAAAPRDDVQDSAYWMETYGAVPVVVDDSDIQTNRPEEGIVTFIVPMTGTAELLKYRPSEFSSHYPEAEVGTDEVLFTYEMAELDGPDELKDRFEEDLLRFKQWLIWSKLDVDKFVQELAGVVDGALVHRREALDAEDALMESLGYPEVESETAAF